MARASFQVLVYPYRQTDTAAFEYALFRRAVVGWWQGIAGGGEDNETPIQAARRETHEEAAILPESEFLHLDTVIPVRATEFNVSHIWGEDVYVIPMYCFGVMANGSDIVLSHEHSEFRWLSYWDAYNLMKYEGNKTALWELEKRLRGGGPRGKIGEP